MNVLNKKMNIGIALSGGGARGIAHIGVLAALEKYGIEPNIISGTSMGALVGVFYAAGFKPEEIRDFIKEKKMYRSIQWAFPSNGLLDLKKVEVAMRNLIGVDDFKSLKKSFHCAVTNLNTGLCEYVSSGELFDYVLASASIPIVFDAKVINGKTYVDGGLLSNLPVEPLVDKADLIIGAHVNHNGDEEEIKGIRNIAERCFRLAIGQNVRESFELCDFVIDPPEVRQYRTFDFEKVDEIYQIGFDATEKYILDFFKFINIENVASELKKRSSKKTS